jgi:hypothetical protein
MKKIIFLLCLWGISGFASAHKSSDAYWNIHVEGQQVHEQIDVALRDIDRDLPLDANQDGQLTWGEIRPHWPALQTLVDQVIVLTPVTQDGSPCRLVGVDAARFDTHSDGGYAIFGRHWNCPAVLASLQLNYTLFAQTDPQHRGIVRFINGSADAQTVTAVLGPQQNHHQFDIQEKNNSTTGALAFLWEGIHHILIGTDHVLFLLSLLLPAVLCRPLKNSGVKKVWQAAPRLKPVLFDIARVVTAFTLAHSITLSLAALGIVTLPSRWVESTIAASVVLAALNNVWPVVREGRWLLTFAFGLIHGFGFANALKDLGLSGGNLVLPLLAFNGGVEIGQLGIVAFFTPLSWKLRHTAFYQRILLRGGSILIAILAAIWLIERVFEVTLLNF